jgi:hypothetical protein
VRTLALLALTLPLLAQNQNARRLNRYEYNATIRDLLATPFQPAADFPADDSGYGFDNIASVLSLSPPLMEKYLAAAEKIARAAIIPPTPPQPSAQRFAASDFHFKVDFEGDYDVLIAVHGRPDSLNMVFSVDGVPAATLPPDASGVAEFRIRFGPGNPRLRVDSPHLSYVELRGPYYPLPPPLSEATAASSAVVTPPAITRSPAPEPILPIWRAARIDVH